MEPFSLQSGFSLKFSSVKECCLNEGTRKGDKIWCQILGLFIVGNPQNKEILGKAIRRRIWTLFHGWDLKFAFDLSLLKLCCVCLDFFGVCYYEVVLNYDILNKNQIFYFCFFIFVAHRQATFNWEDQNTSILYQKNKEYDYL